MNSNFQITIWFVMAMVSFFPFNQIGAVGLEVGLFGYELFLKENMQGKRLEVSGWDFNYNRWRNSFQAEPYLYRTSGESLFVGLKDKQSKNQIVWDLHIQLTSGPDTGLRQYYLGKNSYFGYQLQNFLLGVGRREHLFSPKSFSTQFDAGDGLFLELKPKLGLTLQFFIWDFHSGSLLLSKDQFRSLLSREGILNEGETNNFPVEKPITKHSRNHRRRHSVGLVYGDSFSFRFGVHYLELGSLGPYTKDHPNETKRYLADGDSLLHGNGGFSLHTDILSFDFDFLWCRGNDRTRSKLAATPGSITIAGEALQSGVELRFAGWKIRSSHFISDREEKNEKQQIVKEGFISLGTHPSQTPYLSQIFEVFPSSAITELGYEKNFALLEGRSFGYLTELALSYTYNQFVFKLIGNYFLPYRQTGPTNGRIAFQKREFERFFIAEGMFEVSIREEVSFELGIGISQLFLPESIGIRSNFGYVFGRLQI
ncbi:hypothetical protein LEP1GSC202_3411 [Leptospira yanagawae serovar Saopaulo str. Sao Paulo = ATCC 700523]|uniref:Capsule assembly protein Wzi n=1 Tax=Leptospira yanagawae serovar Saopaulo str. Sao Paulo = ATCC 700523 TaxID=1249483 RepID=A0A5E8HAU3_9LEPT|nr:hypothetical protein [Leptospira yanagawae]EOQ87962.1 hypothetical protein LEP1GSC202_3411 [Leptospira yanagawae serovar Saopaulo str. Sao Paulo = ATCC 700523]